MLLIQSDSKFVFICIYLLVYKNHMLINCFVTQIVQCLVYLLTQMMASFTVIVYQFELFSCASPNFFLTPDFFSQFFGPFWNFKRSCEDVLGIEASHWGQYGDTASYYMTVEQQGQLTLHLHMLLWLKGHLNIRKNSFCL